MNIKQKILLVLALWSSPSCSSSSDKGSGQRPAPPPDPALTENLPEAPVPEQAGPEHPRKAVKLPPIELRITIADRATQIFQTTIKPIFEESCTLNGCHSTAASIDLREFPFDAIGSFIKEKIDRNLGTDATQEKVQAAIIKEIIMSMESGFMPPMLSELELVQEEKIAVVDDWSNSIVNNARRLFTGEIVLTGFVGKEEVCSEIFKYKGAKFHIIFDRSKCAGADSLLVTLMGESRGAKLARKITALAFWQQAFWELDFEAFPEKKVLTH